MSYFLALIIAFAALWLAWRFVGSLFHPREPAEPVDDPFSDVLAPRKRGPQGKAGAVALDEPEDDEDEGFFPPRRQ
jgi:hypothetical protein